MNADEYYAEKFWRGKNPDKPFSEASSLERIMYRFAAEVALPSIEGRDNRIEQLVNELEDAVSVIESNLKPYPRLIYAHKIVRQNKEDLKLNLS